MELATASVRAPGDRSLFGVEVEPLLLRAPCGGGARRATRGRLANMSGDLGEGVIIAVRDIRAALMSASDDPLAEPAIPAILKELNRDPSMKEEK